MMHILLALLLAAPPPCPHPHRSKKAAARFARTHPMPKKCLDAHGKPKTRTLKNGKRVRDCVIDHPCPLECGGPDAPSNMAWQTHAESVAKDRTEGNCKTCPRGTTCPRP